MTTFFKTPYIGDDGVILTRCKSLDIGLLELADPLAADVSLSNACFLRLGDCVNLRGNYRLESLSEMEQPHDPTKSQQYLPETYLGL